MTNTCLQVQQVSRRFSAEKSLGEINLALNSGTKIALLGVNGAGKSSFIRLLVGEDAADTGSILYCDQTDQNVTISPNEIAFKANLGYQPDTMLAIDKMTGAHYLQLCGLLKNLSNDQICESVEALNKSWSIEPLLDKPMSELSKGNLQKLAIAQVFLNEPDFLFFDEPCQSLDPLEQENFNHLIEQLTGFELCMFSTHNVEHALELADEILLFHQSKIAYHFKLPAVSKSGVQDVVLICLQGDVCFEDWLREQCAEAAKLSEQVFKLPTMSDARLKTIQKALEQAPREVNVCLPEKEALLPLFRMLASGEIEDLCAQKRAAQENQQ